MRKQPIVLMLAVGMGFIGLVWQALNEWRPVTVQHVKLRTAFLCSMLAPMSIALLHKPKQEAAQARR